MADIATDPASSGSKIKYVYLELVKSVSGDKYDVIAGLLKLMFNKDGDVYIGLHSIKNSTALVNLKYYNIMTVEYLDYDFRYMAFATQDADDQEEALDMVKTLYKDLCFAGFSQGVEVIAGEEVSIIDVSKYIDVPSDYLCGTEVEKDKLAITNDIVHKPAHTRYARDTATTFVKTPIKPDPEPALLGRTSAKKPTAAALAEIRQKIDGVRAGTYSPEFPDTPAGEASDAEYEEYDQCENNRHFYGGMY